MLRLSLVAVPVKAYPAASSTEAIHFNQLHADCGQRIAYEKHCPAHGAVDAAEIVKGYQYAPGQYVVIEASELESLRSAKDKVALAGTVRGCPRHRSPGVLRPLFVLVAGMPGGAAALLAVGASHARARQVGRGTSRHVRPSASRGRASARPNLGDGRAA
jgi:hypothetical protein